MRSINLPCLFTFSVALLVLITIMSETAPPPAPTSTRVLTQEQLELIASNKAKALERLRAKRKANGEAPPPTTEAAAAPKKAKWIKSFYEYDLSTFEDSKAGFIVDETAGNKKFEEEKKKSYHIAPYYRKYILYDLRSISVCSLLSLYK